MAIDGVKIIDSDDGHDIYNLIVERYRDGTSIDTIATRTDQGNFFKIEAETKITQEQAEKLRYGLEGRLQIITGKKSYLRYYLDDFLNWE